MPTGAIESPTSFLKVLAELVLLGVLGHLGAHDDDLKRTNIFVMKYNVFKDSQQPYIDISSIDHNSRDNTS